MSACNYSPRLLLRSLRTLTAALVWVTLVPMLAGCCSLPWRCPSSDRVIAAREEGRLGLIAMTQGHLSEAGTRLEHALKQCPKDDRLRHDYALVLWQSGRHAEAQSELMTAIDRAGGEPEWLVELGRMLLATQDHAGAEAAAQQAIDLNPELGSAWKLHGDAMRLTQQMQFAVSDYHRALGAGADPNSTLMDLADVYRVQNRPRRALATLKRLDELVAPDDRPLRLVGMKAAALQALGRHEDSLDMFANATKQHPENSELLYMMAVSQSNCGFLESAHRTAVRAAVIQPNDQRIRALLASLPIEKATHQLVSGELPISVVDPDELSDSQ